MQSTLPPSGAKSARRVPRWLSVVLVLLGLAALAVPAVIVRDAPDAVRSSARAEPRSRVVPKAELPPVEPIEFQNVAPDDARSFNATIPFSISPNPPARPFDIHGTPPSQARAVDCLAAAVIYEAGDDAVGERAVAQVVINRVRHPAFPKTICGVVFQGSERRTGCQFTFTCDGAIMRAVSSVAWERAWDIARAALNGRVDRAVGHATHYHTDWVVPYWSSSLDKIVEVHSHLFFRWTGWWGTPPAFRSTYIADEPAVAKLARLSEAHRTPQTEADLAAELAAGLTAGAALPVDPAMPAAAGRDADTFLVTLDPRLSPDGFLALAQQSCGARAYCKFMAWTDKTATPTALPTTPAQQRAMSFSYLRDRSFGFEKALWNCVQFKRTDPAHCMKAQVSMTLSPVDAGPDARPPVRPGARQVAPPPDPLTGVRRKSDAAPAFAPILTKPATPAHSTVPTG